MPESDRLKCAAHAQEVAGTAYSTCDGVAEETTRVAKIRMPAIAAMIEDYRSFLTDKGVTPEELERTRNGNIRELPGAFESARAVLGAMQLSHQRESVPCA